MTFQAYLDNIRTKTGKGPEDFRAAATKAGVLVPGVKAGDLVAWLKQEYGLGRGHAMAIYAVFKSKRWLPPAAGKRS
jgi:hypothetical protein